MASMGSKSEDDDFPTVIATLGGSGTRLYPLTLFQSKPLIPIVNYPIFMRMTEVIARQGARDFVFSTKGVENTLRIKDVFRYGSDFSVRLGLPQRVNFMYQPHYDDKGSADSVRFTMEYYHIDNECFVVSGDNITNIDLTGIARFHRDHNAVATIVLKELPQTEDISGFGIAEIDSNNMITRFVEKPPPGETDSRLINAAIYLFSPEIRKILHEMGDKAKDIGKNLLPYLIEKGYPVYGYKCEGYWADVGTPDNFLRTSLDIAAGKVKNIRFRGEHEVSEKVWIHPTTTHRLTKGLFKVERNTVIGGDCEIHPTAVIENSIIGDNCIIKENVHIKDSVVMDFVNVHENSTLRSCIVGRYAKLGSGSTIDSQSYVEVTGKKDKTAVIGDGVHIIRDSFLGAYKRVAPITYAHTILKTGKFTDLGYDQDNMYFIEK